MNVVVAAAKNYGIEPFASLAIPRVKDFGADTNQEFRADLDHYLTQLLLDNSSRAKRDSVLVPLEWKTTIWTYLFHLRELIEKADDLDQAKRESLLRCLSEFEAELEKEAEPIGRYNARDNVLWSTRGSVVIGRRCKQGADQHLTCCWRGQNS